MQTDSATLLAKGPPLVPSELGQHPQQRFLPGIAIAAGHPAVSAGIMRNS
jgi:hypothetical protein